MPDNNEPIDAQRLEARLDELVEAIERLSGENAHLSKEQNDLRLRCSELAKKNERVRERIEAMVSRLKALEKD